MVIECAAMLEGTKRGQRGDKEGPGYLPRKFCSMVLVLALAAINFLVILNPQLPAKHST